MLDGNNGGQGECDGAELELLQPLTLTDCQEVLAWVLAWMLSFSYSYVCFVEDLNWNALEWDRAAEELTWERVGILLFTFVCSVRTET